MLTFKDLAAGEVIADEKFSALNGILAQSCGHYKKVIGVWDIEIRVLGPEHVVIFGAVNEANKNAWVNIFALGNEEVIVKRIVFELFLDSFGSSYSKIWVLIVLGSVVHSILDMLLNLRVILLNGRLMLSCCYLISVICKIEMDSLIL